MPLEIPPPKPEQLNPAAVVEPASKDELNQTQSVSNKPLSSLNFSKIDRNKLLIQSSHDVTTVIGGISANDLSEATSSSELHPSFIAGKYDVQDRPTSTYKHNPIHNNGLYANYENIKIAEASILDRLMHRLGIESFDYFVNLKQEEQAVNLTLNSTNVKHSFYVKSLDNVEYVVSGTPVSQFFDWLSNGQARMSAVRMIYNGESIKFSPRINLSIPSKIPLSLSAEIDGWFEKTEGLSPLHSHMFSGEGKSLGNAHLALNSYAFKESPMILTRLDLSSQSGHSLSAILGTTRIAEKDPQEFRNFFALRDSNVLNIPSGKSLKLTAELLYRQEKSASNPLYETLSATLVGQSGDSFSLGLGVAGINDKQTDGWKLDHSLSLIFTR